MRAAQAVAMVNLLSFATYSLSDDEVLPSITEAAARQKNSVTRFRLAHAYRWSCVPFRVRCPWRVCTLAS